MSLPRVCAMSSLYTDWCVAMISSALLKMLPRATGTNSGVGACVCHDHVHVMP